MLSITLRGGQHQCFTFGTSLDSASHAFTSYTVTDSVEYVEDTLRIVSGAEQIPEKQLSLTPCHFYEGILPSVPPQAYLLPLLKCR